MSDQDESVDAPAFIRQRRNIILASLVLTFAQSTHLTIDHFIFFGTTGHIDSPVATTPFLWVVWGYFLWRYWQAFSAYARKPTKERYRTVKKKYVDALARRRVLAQFSGQKCQLVGASRNGKMEPDAWMPHDEETRTPAGASVTMVTNLLDDAGKQQRNVDVELSTCDMRVIGLKAKLELALTSNEVSEFFLPYAIALIPVAVYACQAIRK